MVKRLFRLLLSCTALALSFFILRSAMLLYYRAAYPVAYQELVEQYCEEFAAPQDLVYAVIHTESGFDPMAKSNVGARGLMQIMPDTFNWARFRLGEPAYESHAQLHQPNVNLRYGIATLSLLVEEFGDTSEALAAYHAGRGSVNKWLKDSRYSADGETLVEIPFPETRAYIAKIARTRQIYRNLYHTIPQ